MHKSQILFYLTTALHVSGVTITHLQEHKTTVTTASGNHYTVLLSAAIVEELELISTCFGRHYHPSSGAQNNSNYSTTEQGTGQQNPLFQFAIDIMLTSANT
jgi:hypothetical protein